MQEDLELLRRYVEERADDAFGLLVRRHLDLVYFSALRRTNGDAALAQDVTQLVFVALAREAGALRSHPGLTGWLYVTTRHAAAQAMRTERRRVRREQEAFAMHEPSPPPGASADWDRIRPELDAVLDELEERDRDAVLLRFFQNRPFAEIGSVLRVSDDAARMRVDRALEKLRGLLARRGVTSTAAALALALGQQGALAAPATVAAGVTSALAASGALGGGAVVGAAGWFQFMSTTKIGVGIAGAIAALALGAAWHQAGRARDAEAALAQLTQAQAGRIPLPTGKAPTAERSPGAAGLPSGTRPVRPATARGQLQAETAAALQRPKVTEKYLSLISILDRLSADNWREVLTAFADERKLTGLAHPEAFELFARRAGEVAGKDAVGAFLRSGNLTSANDALMGWASRNPAEALEWLGREADARTRQAVQGAAIRGLALSEPDLALRTLEGLPAGERGRYTDELVTSMLHAVGIDATQRLVEGMIARAADAGSLREGYVKNVFSDYAMLRLRQSAASGTLADTIKWLDPQVGQPYIDHQVIAEAATRLAGQDPRETFRWLETVNTTLLGAGDDSTAGYRVLLASWAGKEGAPAVEQWLQTQTAHPHYDHLAYQYVALTATRDQAKAEQWAASIKSDTIRKNALDLIAQKAPRKNS